MGKRSLCAWIFSTIAGAGRRSLRSSCSSLPPRSPAEGSCSSCRRKRARTPSLRRGRRPGSFSRPPPVASGLCGTTGRGSCSREGLVCEIGGDPASACNTLTICDAGTLKPLDVLDTHCPTVNNGVGPSCPGLEAKGTVGDGGTICIPGTTCDYAQGRCQCAIVSPSLSPSWRCEDPGSACPSVRPRLGQPCTQQGQRCTYDACGITPSFGSELCDGGVWIATEPPTCAN